MNVSGALLSRIRRPSSIVVQKQLLIIPGCMASTKTGGQEDDDRLRRRMIEKIIRVDHAGEMGASYIYQGKSKSYNVADDMFLSEIPYVYNTDCQ